MFTQYLSNPASLFAALVPTGSGIALEPGSIVLNASAPATVQFYDGANASLGIGAGLLLTSGHAPGPLNDVGWDGADNSFASGVFDNGDADIDAVVNSVFKTQSYDATTLEFDFTVTDPDATSVSFDLVFGSEEFPEWVDQFVDCAVVIVNGVNYALFNHDPLHPLSVVSPNLAAGYFNDNFGNPFQIQYDGLSNLLKIVAPVHGGGAVNHIKIGIADTGDHIYDSGIFIANLVAGTTPGSGVVSSTVCTDSPDTVIGSTQDELIDLKGGDDIAYAGGGDDIVIGGAGDDQIYGGTGHDVLEGDAGDDHLDGGEGADDVAVYVGPKAAYAVSMAGAGWTVSGGSEGVDTLVQIESLQFADGLFDLDPNAPGYLVPHASGGGTPVNAAGSVTVAGIAMDGKTLTAIVTDANGVPGSGAVAYHWLSSIDGITWTDTGVTAKSYDVPLGAEGTQVMASATYVDAAGFAESPASAAVTIAQAGTEVTIELMQLAAPAGASVQNPLTTLLANAIGLGSSANEAAQAIRGALQLPDVALSTYDAYAQLVADPADATALAVLKVATQVAMTASVSDPTGFNLTLAVLDAAAAGQTLNLADLPTLTNLIPGLPAGDLDMLHGLNLDMADAANFAKVGGVWDDYCGMQDQLKPYIGHLETLSLHLNQPPTGSAPVALPDAAAGAAYLVSETDLLAGFADPEGHPLQIDWITTDQGSWLAPNGDGTWTLTPPPGYTGPLELSYTVSDGQGGSAAATVMLVVKAPPPVNHAPQIATTSIVYLDTTAADTFAANTGVLAASDVDGDSLGFGIVGGTVGGGFATITGQYGELRVDTATGAYDYTPNGAAIEALKANSSESFTVTASDGQAEASATFAVALVGADDPTTFGGSTSGSVTEDATLGAAGTLTASDCDSGDAAITVQTNVQGSFGTFSIDAAGHWVYTLDNASAGVQALNAGEFGTDSFSVATAGGASTPVTIAVHGADDVTAVTGTSGNDTLTGTDGADLISGLAGNDVIDARGGNDTVDAGAGNDTVAGAGGDDLLRGGTGADQLSGGTGRDIFAFAAGDSGQTKGFDRIIDFAKGALGDRIDYSAALAVGGSAAAATGKQAAIDPVTGIASFAARSGGSLSDALGDIAARFTAAGDSAGEFALFRVGGRGNFHLFVSDGKAGVGAGDLVVELVGITGVAAIDLAGGDLALIA